MFIQRFSFWRRSLEVILFTKQHSRGRLQHFDSGNAVRRLSTKTANSMNSQSPAKTFMGDLTKEGKAEVFLPTSVFYNPVQEFNRDLTIAIVSQHARDHIARVRAKREKQTHSNGNAERANDAAEALKNTADPNKLEAGTKYDDGLRILEGLAASGLRSVRFAKEIPGVREVVANDFDRTAVEFIQKNVDHNEVSHLVWPNCADAAMVMYENRKYADRFDVIDLDPYGSPVAFLDGAVQALTDGGLLCVTCTDVAILCGNAPETCYSKYGAMPLKGKYCHEMALRIVLQTIEAHANRYSRYIEPLVSVSVDFYVRLFVRIHTGQHYVKQSVAKLAMVYNCVGCGGFYIQPIAKQTQTKGDNYKFTPANAPTVGKLCEECGHKFHLGGPVWAKAIHDRDFVQQIISNVTDKASRFGTSERIKGMLTVIYEELPDVPFFYVIDHLSKVLRCEAPPLLSIRSAIMDAGYEVSLSHTAKSSIKTTAPNHVIWDVFRCWIKEHPVNLKNVKEGAPGRTIVLKEPKISVSFDIREDANPKSRKSGLVRWQQNPVRDWGPKPRAKKGVLETLDDRRERGKIKAHRAQATKRKAHTQGESEAQEGKRPSTGSTQSGDENMNVETEKAEGTDDKNNT